MILAVAIGITGYTLGAFVLASALGRCLRASSMPADPLRIEASDHIVESALVRLDRLQHALTG